MSLTLASLTFAAWPALVVVVPLLVALVIPVVGRRGRATAWGLAAAALVFAAWGSVEMLLHVLQTGETLVYRMGGWAAPTGIEYVVDALNAMVLAMVAVVGALAALWMRRTLAREIRDRAQRSYQAVFLLFLAGLMGITITGDVFNLYVFLEIASITSYVLIAMGRRRQALYAGFSYLILGSLGATFILLGIGHLYQATGSLAMADIAQQLADPALHQEMGSVLHTSYAFFAVGLALKMALFPLHAWQPAAYTYAPSGASLVIAATSTKVSAYAFYRISLDLFGPDFLPAFFPAARDVLLVVCAAAIVVGPLIALRQDDLKRLLAYSSVGQIGYIVLGIVLLHDGEQGLEGPIGGLMHFWNHAVAKGALFCVAGALAYQTGRTRVVDLAGLGRRAPWTATVMTVACCSMVGVPLSAGFWSKFYLATGALGAGLPLGAVVLLVSSLLTAVYCWRLLTLVWFTSEDTEAVVRSDVPWSMRWPALVLGAGCVVLFFAPVHHEIARAAAEGFLR